VVQQSLGGDLIAAVAVIGAETRQPAHEDVTDMFGGAIGLPSISKLTKELWLKKQQQNKTECLFC